MKKNAIVTMLFLSISILGFSQDVKVLDQKIQKAVQDYDLPGLSIALVKNGEADFVKAYGFANLEKETVLQTNSIFGIASLSKAFTATAIAMLVDEGKLNWKDRVSKYIPGFNLSDEYIAAQMTIEDLLAHRSGFNTFDGDLLWYGTNYSRKEIIQRFSKYKMTYDFRTEYGYQNIMFIIAGEVVESVSGMSWDEFVENRIFKPLAMDHSYTSVDQIPKNASIAMPHVKGKLDALRNYDNSGGAAALSSNVEDLSKWIKFWLNDGIVGTDTLLQKGSYLKLLELHTSIPPSAFERSNGIQFKGYAQGWFLMDYDGDKVAHHGGGLPGYISKVFIVPGQKLGAIVLTNGETSLPTALMYDCIDHYKGNEDKNFAGLYLKFSKRYEVYLEKKEKDRIEARDESLQSNIDAVDLIGLYEDKVYGKAEVTMKGDQLIFSMLPAKEIFTSDMTHWQQNTFRIKFSDLFLPAGYLTFEANADGEVVGLKVDLPNPDFHFHNLDFKKLK